MKRIHFWLLAWLAAFPAVAASFAQGREVARLPMALEEISGLAASRAQAGVLWMHNDSGSGPVVYAVATDGALRGSYTLEGAGAVDWEDMAIGPAPDGGWYLYLADIGDNNALRRSVEIYRVREPEVPATGRAAEVTLNDVVRFTLMYPDGAHDAEGFMVDPLTGDFYLVTKREWQNLLFRAASPNAGEVNQLEQVGSFPFPGTTGADISPDGMQVLIRRYSSNLNLFTPPSTAASYWKRESVRLSLPELLAQDGEIVPLVSEAQGEAIAFAADGEGFYTTSEHGSARIERVAPSPLIFYAPVE